MNCERCQTELEDFLYGELPDAQAAEIRAHLASCAECAALRQELEREQELFSQFYEQTALEPSGEMWEAIRARLHEEPRSALSPSQSAPGWRTWLRESSFAWLLQPALLRQAAFAVLLITLSVAATSYFLKRGGDTNQNLAQNTGPAASPGVTQTPAVTVTPAPPSFKQSATPETTVAQTTTQPKTALPVAVPRQLSEQELMSQQIARAAREYEKAIKLLGQAIAKRRDGMDQNVFKQYESSLALINDSLATSRRALRERPDDLAAGQFLLAAYAKKVELMQEIALQ
ncbi:MAG: anti-sigma factor [Acidobacteriota bacterium]